MHLIIVPLSVSASARTHVLNIMEHHHVTSIHMTQLSVGSTACDDNMYIELM